MTSAAVRGLYSPALPSKMVKRSALPWGGMPLLAKVLSHQPPPSVVGSSEWDAYADSVKSDIRDLPECLREHVSTISKMANKVIDPDTRAHYREFCPLHQKLNRTIVCCICYAIRSEIDTNIPAMVHALASKNLLAESIRRAFVELRQCCSMWWHDGRYKNFLGEAPKPKWAFQTDKCAACILARIGSDPAIIVPLAAGMSARAPRSGRRQAYVDALFSNFPEAQATALRMQAATLATQLRNVLGEYICAQRGEALEPITDPLTGEIVTDPSVFEGEAPPARGPSLGPSPRRESVSVADSPTASEYEHPRARWPKHVTHVSSRPGSVSSMRSTVTVTPSEFLGPKTVYSPSVYDSDSETNRWWRPAPPDSARGSGEHEDLYADIDDIIDEYRATVPLAGAHVEGVADDTSEISDPRGRRTETEGRGGVKETLKRAFSRSRVSQAVLRVDTRRAQRNRDDRRAEGAQNAGPSTAKPGLLGSATLRNILPRSKRGKESKITTPVTGSGPTASETRCRFAPDSPEPRGYVPSELGKPGAAEWAQDYRRQLAATPTEREFGRRPGSSSSSVYSKVTRWSKFAGPSK
ncbi:hypothetical protein EJ06DRAFT_252613 [Trichodelitschia bisporula]|uniref:Uncharacterized protein n=1 Tax=Trichodelitschia bisporula TaxID=703511 RepID=A0A6G1HJ10_9PEZI|nr:hypothetical protein EJ06DRAFT_252613 [Trichodelitschia bisporula]